LSAGQGRCLISIQNKRYSQTSYLQGVLFDYSMHLNYKLLQSGRNSAPSAVQVWSLMRKRRTTLGQHFLDRVNRKLTSKVMQYLSTNLLGRSDTGL
jgi:hypothetical protein